MNWKCLYLNLILISSNQIRNAIDCRRYSLIRHVFLLKWVINCIIKSITNKDDAIAKCFIEFVIFAKDIPSYCVWMELTIDYRRGNDSSWKQTYKWRPTNMLDFLFNIMFAATQRRNVASPEKWIRNQHVSQYSLMIFVARWNVRGWLDPQSGRRHTFYEVHSW